MMGANKDALNFKKNVALDSYNTFSINAQAEYFATITSETELIKLLKSVSENSIPVTVLGGGSNILISQNKIKGLTVKIDIKDVTYEDKSDVTEVCAGAGVLLDDLVLDTVEKGLWGLENLSHIPGTVGAAPVQNVGAYGVEVSDYIKDVYAVDRFTGEQKKFTNKECKFNYRTSIFKTDLGKKYIVTKVVFVLSKKPQPLLSYGGLQSAFGDTVPIQTAIREEIIKIRSSKFPDWHKIGTAGSFFKNPIISESDYLSLKRTYPEIPGFTMNEGEVKVPLGWILDHVCNLRGYKQGNVGTYANQALVVVNYGGATAEEITFFVKDIEQKVKEKTGINIEWEVTIV